MLCPGCSEQRVRLDAGQRLPLLIGRIRRTTGGSSCWLTAIRAQGTRQHSGSHRSVGRRPAAAVWRALHALCLEQSHGALMYMLSKYPLRALLAIHWATAARYREALPLPELRATPAIGLAVGSAVAPPLAPACLAAGHSGDAAIISCEPSGQPPPPGRLSLSPKRLAATT